MGEAADALGISKPTLDKLVKTGKLPYVPVGTKRRIPVADLERYRQRQHQG